MIIFDTETTGLDPKIHRIVSIAASCGGEEFYSLVNPGCRIPRVATKVHGLGDADVAGCPGWASVGVAFWEWVRAHTEGDVVVLVGHNAARFDLPLLLNETARMPAAPAWLPARLELVDTLRLCRSKLRMLSSHRQATVYSALFGAPPADAHNALGDVRALARILSHPPLARATSEFRKNVTPALWGPWRNPKRCITCSRITSPYFTHACA